MRVATLLVSGLLLGASACAEQPGPPEQPAPGGQGETDAELVAEEVAGANAEAEGALRLSRQVLNKISVADLQDPVRAVLRGVGGGAGCSTSVETRPNEVGAVYVTFDNCRGVFDAQTLSGKLRFFFGKTPGAPGLRVNVGVADGSTLVIEGAAVTRYKIDASLSFPAEGTTALSWEVDWARQGKAGRNLSLQARFRTVVRAGLPECSTTSGRASFEAGERGFWFDVDGYKVCTRPLMLEAVCPSAGAWSVTDDASRTVTFQFTGEDAPPGPGGARKTLLRIIDAEGDQREIGVRCGGQAGGG